MDNTAIILEIFIRAGYLFTAALLGVSWFFARRQRPALIQMSRMANGLAGLYALCMTMIGIVFFIRTYRGGDDLVRDRLWGFALAELLPLLALVVLFLTVRKRPQWLLLPFAILVNFSLIRAPAVSATDQLLVQLWSAKPYILLLMGLLFLLLVFLLYLLGIWLRRIAPESETT